MMEQPEVEALLPVSSSNKNNLSSAVCFSLVYPHHHHRSSRWQS